MAQWATLEQKAEQTRFRVLQGFVCLSQFTHSMSLVLFQVIDAQWVACFALGLLPPYVVLLGATPPNPTCKCVCLHPWQVNT